MKSWFFEKIDWIDKQLFKQTKTRMVKNQMDEIRDKMEAFQKNIIKNQKIINLYLKRQSSTKLEY